ncbi:MAG TPA: nuclear transport factor 2 family protein [Anaerolineales bacterium]|nr:nuclear transport factor 2 family protein [Anaerolineales bacterium]
MTQPTSTDLIRSAREAFNRAIAEKDAKYIRPLLAASYHLVTGRSDQFHGADEEEIRWAQLFQQDPTAVYRRTPREITTNDSWGIAEELGNWQGEYSINGNLVHASGVYAAKWQRTTQNNWVLQVEIFTTIKYDESCIPPDLL